MKTADRSPAAVEKLAKRLRSQFYRGQGPLVPFHASSSWPNWEVVAEYVLKRYEPKPRRRAKGKKPCLSGFLPIARESERLRGRDEK